MKKITIILLSMLLIVGSGCKKYLDINDNPNGPSHADPALYLPSIEAQYAQGLQFDGRMLGPYIQNFQNNISGNTLDRHGYFSGSDFGASMWRNVYWKGGQNTLDLINYAREQTKWDLVGVGMALQAYGWQMLTDYHGPIILKEAFDPARNTFDYDMEDTVYAFTKRLCLDAINELNKNTDVVGSPFFIKYDQIYKGDRDKWKKFVYGILAINAHHLIKKSSYNADDVINYVNQALASNADNAMVPFAGTIPDDGNVYGPLNNGSSTSTTANFWSYGQSAFIVNLTNGTIFGLADPRQAIMLSPSGDGVYRGLTPAAGQSSTVSSSTTGVKSMYGTTLGASASQSTPGSVGKYLFNDKASFPLMTYAELQFIKAEAAFTKGDKPLALAAYTAAVNASLDFVRSYTTDAILIANFNTLKPAYLASPAVIPATAADLTINQILLQKYIALWAWGYIETWTDLRKYDYSNTVFTSFTLPSTFYVDNNNKPAYRVRPRYNSEYLWNIEALTAIGGFDPDYHTKKIWINIP